MRGCPRHLRGVSRNGWTHAAATSPATDKAPVKSQGRRTSCARAVWSVHERNELLWCQYAEALGHELAHLLPIGVLVEHHADGIAAPPEEEERVTAGDERAPFLIGRSERHDGHDAAVVVMEREHVSEI